MDLLEISAVDFENYAFMIYSTSWCIDAMYVSVSMSLVIAHQVKEMTVKQWVHHKWGTLGHQQTLIWCNLKNNNTHRQHIRAWTKRSPFEDGIFKGIFLNVLLYLHYICTDVYSRRSD